MDHETAFVKAFIKREKWARYLQLLANRKRREEILVRLNHKLDYLPALATEVPEDQDYPEALERLLRDQRRSGHLPCPGERAAHRWLRGPAPGSPGHRLHAHVQAPCCPASPASWPTTGQRRREPACCLTTTPTSILEPNHATGRPSQGKMADCASLPRHPLSSTESP